MNAYKYVKASLQRRKAWLDELKSGPCVDCGEKYPGEPFLKDWDHRDPKQKKFAISRALRRHSRAVVLEEIAKCDLRCCVCHRRRTQKMRA